MVDSQFPGTLGLDPMPPPLCTHLPRMSPIGSNPRPHPQMPWESHEFPEVEGGCRHCVRPCL